MNIIFHTTFIGLLFNISFFFSNGNIVDSKLKYHQHHDGGTKNKFRITKAEKTK